MNFAECHMGKTYISRPDPRFLFVPSLTEEESAELNLANEIENVLINIGGKFKIRFT